MIKLKIFNCRGSGRDSQNGCSQGCLAPDGTRIFKILKQALGVNLKGRLSHRQYRSPSWLIYILLIIFSEKNTIFLRESCQIVQPLAPDQIPVEAKENNYGLSNPGSIQAYLQVVDLMADKLRYASIFLININLLFLLSSKICLNGLCFSFTNNQRFIVQSIGQSKY